MKHRLRHPVRAIREPFGTAGLIVACIALVLALGGAALAAQGLNPKQKKEVEKIAKKFAGKPGAPGTNGTNGTNGTKGDTGAAGAAGKDGSPGVAGESVTVSAASGAECATGGSKFSNKSGSGHVCNGTNGTTGYTETLPSTKTETGTWAISGSGVEGAMLNMYAPISYSIPLAAPSEHVVLLSKAETDTSTATPVEGCKYDPTNAGAKPVAPAGTLCVFTLLEEWGKPSAVVTPSANGDRVTGAFVKAVPESLGTSEEAPPVLAQLLGVWAVTAK